MKKDHKLLGHDSCFVFTGDLIFEMQNDKVVRSYIETAPIKAIGDYFNHKNKENNLCEIEDELLNDYHFQKQEFKWIAILNYKN